jgi:hypothetical protein
MTNTGAGVAAKAVAKTAAEGAKKPSRAANFRGTNGNRWNVSKHHPGMT